MAQYPIAVSNSPVGKVADSNAVIGCVVPKYVVTEIDGRRATLSMTRSKYASLILQWWYAKGCPGVTQADATMRALSDNPGKGRGHNKTNSAA